MLDWPQMLASVGQRFWSKVDKSGGDEACWPFKGASRGGYGKFKLESYLSVQAHRVAYALATGESPGELHVLHRCDNRPCCNPSHHFLGTNKDNVDDKMAKGRHVTVDQSGSNNGASKLTEAQVEVIRVRILGGQTNVRIAADFGVTHQLISRIRRGKAWGEPPMQAPYASLKLPRTGGE